METPQLNRPVSRDRGVSDSFAIRPQAGNERDPNCNRPSTQGTDENRSPVTLPRAFEGMLKTTTETGDIGMFSIKPSRVPQSLNTPRRICESYNDNRLQNSRQSFHPFGVPNVDDRQRLPSYARDTTSEVISMYETASQKSASRVFDDPDYRSYYMTQTSYSAYTLSNHRSCTSLRSQQDSNGLLQRPRSPFAYPTRLKRPGFRPSSPALTDGGVVDYSRRVEIDRTPYGGVHTTSSPSSLYALKRKPPLSLRQEANRSTPSLLSQPSPPRRSPSPGLRQSNGNLANEWTRRIGSTSGNTSPARSTFSLASTVNLYATATATSNSTTPGKLPPSSPLYYDYTEDFEVDSFNRPAETLGSPPQFSIDKTIPEERPMSAEWPALTGLKAFRASNSVRDFPSPAPAFPKLEEDTPNHRAVLPGERRSGAIQSSLDERNPRYNHPVREADKKEDTKVIRLSGLGSGARELSSHVEEAFGLLPAPSFEISMPRNDSEETSSGSTKDRVLVDQSDGNVGMKSTRISSCRVDAYPPRFSSLPVVQFKSREDATINSKRKTSIGDTLLKVQTSRKSIQLSEPSNALADHLMSEEVGSRQGSDSAFVSSSQSRVRSSSGFKSSDKGFTELADLIKTLEDSNRARNPEKEHQFLTAPDRTPMFAATILNGSIQQNTHLGHNFTPVSSFNRSDTKNNPLTTQTQPMKQAQPYSGGRKIEVSQLGTPQQSDVPSFSHHMTMKAIPRSGSPMLAPKPISPARQLKLKNSVPHLMKALPPLPPEPPVRAISPPDRSNSPEHELPCRFSPILPEVSAVSVKETSRGPGEIAPPVPAKEDVSRAPAEFGSAISEVICTSTQPRSAQISPTISQPPPRLKLKMRSSASLQPLLPPDSVAQNREENYPWSAPNLNAPLLAAVQAEKSAISKPPKFRLKITRASGSTYDTVRVNRESGESNVGTGFHLRNHRDLFTYTPRIDNIFQQVSQHLHSRKTSANSNNGAESHPALASTISPSSHLTSMGTFPMTDVDPSGSQSTKPLPITEARSVFSDDSSHIQDHNSMRGRFSNLRARVAVPYVNRTGSQSYDDLTWRDRNGGRVAAPAAKRTFSNSYTRRKSTETRPLRRFAEKMQTHRLKEKVQGWLMEARLAIASRMKSRSTT